MGAPFFFIAVLIAQQSRPFCSTRHRRRNWPGRIRGVERSRSGQYHRRVSVSQCGFLPLRLKFPFGQNAQQSATIRLIEQHV